MGVSHFARMPQSCNLTPLQRSGRVTIFITPPAISAKTEKPSGNTNLYLFITTYYATSFPGLQQPVPALQDHRVAVHVFVPDLDFCGIILFFTNRMFFCL